MKTTLGENKMFTHIKIIDSRNKHSNAISKKKEVRF